ncbi:MAG: prepilin-type N-terminal cleavage/methylation domain-containing protein [Planctomycetes bacterium]|nr:prepilin-type N-terminal cleavage/methylation domain-containing protein [Planctomycetota bacterium]
MRTVRNGFTIIELLIAVGLMVVLTGIAVFVFTQAVDIFVRTDAAAKIYQNARAGLRILERELKQAQPILTADDQKNDVIFRIVSGFTTPGQTPGGAAGVPLPGFFDMIEVKTSTRDAGGNSLTTQVRYCVKPIAGTPFGVLKRVVDEDITTAGVNWKEQTICEFLDYFVVEYKVRDDSATTDDLKAGRWYHPQANVAPGTGLIPNNYTNDTYCKKWDAGTSSFATGTDYWSGTLAIPGAFPFAFNTPRPGVVIDSVKADFDQGPAPSEIRITMGVRDERSHERRIIHRNIMLPLSR